MLVSASHEEGVLEEEQEEMLHSVFDFSNTTASEVMTPRTDMICVSANTTVKDFVNSALKHGLSRLPVYEEDIDSIFGLVHIRDGLKAIVEHKEYAPIRELARKILIVPENKDAGDLLTEFKKTKTHMAIVVDEYGTTRGLVTIEDLLEELVGDIADEYDVVAESISLQEDGTVIMDARISLDDANEKLGLNIEDEQFNTIARHDIGLLGREPKVGDEVGNEQHTLRVEEADRHRIIRLRLIRRPFKLAGHADSDGKKTEADKKAEHAEDLPKQDKENKSNKSVESTK
jgi:CBS domain containing-hemolysin-like protein